MKLIKAKCPSCKEIITVDGDSDSTKCEFCGDKISIKEAIVEFLTSGEKVKDIDKKEKVKKVEEEKKIVEEEIELEIEPEVVEKPKVDKQKKKFSKSKSSSEVEKYIQQADSYLYGFDYDKAYDYYVKVLEIDEDNKYADFRTSYINLSHNMSSKDKLMSTYEKLMDLDYCYDHEGHISKDLVSFRLEFLDVLVTHSNDRHEYLTTNKDCSLDEVKNIFNMWYLYLYLFENILNEEDTNKKIREKVLKYVVDLIYYLQSVYRYCDESSNYGPTHRDFQDLNNYDTLDQKRVKYSNELLAIDPSYRSSLKNPVVKKSNTSLKRSYSIPLNYFKEGFKHAWWVLVACIFYSLLHYFFGI